MLSQWRCAIFIISVIISLLLFSKLEKYNLINKKRKI